MDLKNLFFKFQRNPPVRNALGYTGPLMTLLDNLQMESNVPVKGSVCLRYSYRPVKYPLGSDLCVTLGESLTCEETIWFLTFNGILKFWTPH